MDDPDPPDPSLSSVLLEPPQPNPPRSAPSPAAPPHQHPDSSPPSPDLSFGRSPSSPLPGFGEFKASDAPTRSPLGSPAPPSEHGSHAGGSCAGACSGFGVHRPAPAPAPGLAPTLSQPAQVRRTSNLDGRCPPHRPHARLAAFPPRPFLSTRNAARWGGQSSVGGPTRMKIYSPTSRSAIALLRRTWRPLAGR